MHNSYIISEKIRHLPVHLIDLLIGSMDADRLSQIQLISLGDRIINLIAVMGSIEYLRFQNRSKVAINKDIDVLLHNLFSESCGLELGISCCLIREFKKYESKETPLGLFKISEDLLSSWTSLRKEINKIKRAKQLFMLGKKISEMTLLLLDRVEEIRQEGNSTVLPEFFQQSLNPSGFFDLILYSDCSECDRKHLFVFDHFYSEDEAYIYTNWGFQHIRQIKDKSKISFLSNKYLNSAHNSKRQSKEVSLLPLFADSYPAMNKLANILMEEATEKTKRELWQEEYKKNVTEDLTKKDIDLKSLILLDCIKRNPIEVLQDIARWEPDEDDMSELERYLRRIAYSQKDDTQAAEYLAQVKQQIDKVEDDIERSNQPNAGRLKKEARNEILAFEVAKLLGFPVKRITDLYNLEYYQNEIYKLKTTVEYARNEEEVRGVFNKGNELLEKVLEELCVFYSYLTYVFLQNGKNNEWMEVRTEIPKMGSGRLLPLMIKLNEESIALGDRLSLLTGWTKYFNEKKLNSITRNGTESFIIKLRNKTHHRAFEEVKEKGVLFVDIIADMFNFFGNDQWRVFPFKLHFTVLTKTSHGIKTCQYITNLTSSSSANKDKDSEQRIIYTDIEIDFMKTYYCLPNARKCFKKIRVEPLKDVKDIWVDPLLIPIEDVMQT